MFVQRQYVNNLTCCIKQIHSCATLNTVKKQAKMMAKLLTGSHRKRKNWYITEKQAMIPILPTEKKFQTGILKKSRNEVLNKLFMRSLSDLLSTGEVTSDLIGRGLSITKVKVSTDFSVLNVYWTAKGTIHDQNFENILKKAAFDLRHALCQLHVLGNVPRISFVPDKDHISLNVMEECFEQLKLSGELDKEDCFENLKTECQLETSLDPDLLEQIRELEDEDFAVSLPEMTHDVLGLDHASVIKKIRGAVVKSQARHRTADFDSRAHETYTENEKPSDLSSPYCDRGLFEVAKFVKKQKLIKEKMMRAQRKELLSAVSDSDEPHVEEYVDIADGDFIEENDNDSYRK